MPRRNRRPTRAKRKQLVEAGADDHTKLTISNQAGELPLNIKSSDSSNNGEEDSVSTDARSDDDVEDVQMDTMLSLYKLANQQLPHQPSSSIELSFVCFGQADGVTPEPKNVTQAVKLRCKVLDALYIFSVPRSKRPKVTWTTDETDPRLGPKTDFEWGEAFIYHLILSINRGFIYVVDASDVIFEVPSILHGKMRLTKSPGYYASLLANFDIRRTDGKWLSWLKLEGVTEDLQEGMTLAWRPYLAFKYWEDRPHLSDQANRAAQFCKRLATFRPSWDYHPCTWSKEAHDMMNPLFPNVWSLIVTAFTKDEVMSLIVVGKITSLPQERPQHLKWMFWDPVKAVPPRNFIFAERDGSNS